MKKNKFLKGMQNNSMQFFNFGPQNSAFGADGQVTEEELADAIMVLRNMGWDGKSAFGFNADAMGFNADAMGFNQNPVFSQMPSGAAQVKAMLQQQVASGALTTFSMRAVYIPGPGPINNPVDVTFFRMNFNNGVFNPLGQLVFTNTTGDTVVVTGLTERLDILFDIAKTEPFRIAYQRVTPKTQTQFDFSMDVLHNTQWKSGYFNTIEPRVYKDPYQFDQLEIDIPMNMLASRKDGWTWRIDTDQTGNGVSIVLFVSQTLDPSKALQGKPDVRNLNGGNINNFFTPSAPAAQLQQAIMTKELGNLSKNPIIKGLAIQLKK